MDSMENRWKLITHSYKNAFIHYLKYTTRRIEDKKKTESDPKSEPIFVLQNAHQLNGNGAFMVQRPGFSYAY